MKEIALLAIAILFVLGLISMCVVLISMGIDSRKLWEMRNLLEKQNKELTKGGYNA
jgi:hypothetical protein